MLNYSNTATVLQNELLDKIKSFNLGERENTLHALLFRYISFQPEMDNLFFVTNERESVVIGQYVDLLNVNNKTDLITFPYPEELNRLEINYISEIIKEKNSLNYKFDILLLPANVLNELCDSGDFDLYGILTSSAIVILYGQKTTQPNLKIQLLDSIETGASVFNVYQNASFIPDYISNRIQEFIKTIDACDFTNKAEFKKLVNNSALLENFIQDNRKEYKLHNICYYINELKNSLLNIYISDIYDPLLRDDLGSILDTLKSICNS